MSATVPPPAATEIRFEDAPLVRHGNTSYRDLMNVRFGRLIVVERRKNPKTGRHVWILRCECGKFCNSTVENLRQGHKTSCGCIRFGRPPNVTAPHRDEVIRLFTDPEKPADRTIRDIAVLVGVTKNAAIGVLNRAKLLGKSTRVIKSAQEIFPKPNTCYWMYGEFGKDGFSWCGKPCESGSYCPEHHEIVFFKPTPAKRRVPSH